MAVQEARQSAHDGGCTCGDCPLGAREGHRRAVAQFLAKRDELASGQGLPAAVAHSAGASRQWVSDELTLSAVRVAERGRAEGGTWPASLAQQTFPVVWAGALLFVLVEALTAIGTGWSLARTAGLIAVLVLAALLTGAAHWHRARGGVLAPLVGDDNRLSTSRAVAALWLVFLVFALLILAVELAGTSSRAGRDALLDGLALDHGAGVVTVAAASCLTAVFVRRVVAVRIAAGRLQKLRADRPHGADLLTDDAGRASFTDVQFLVINAAALVLAAVGLARRPDQLPDVPWGIALLVLVSAATYLAAKFADSGRPVILSVVRAHEAGDLDSPIRTGDDIEIRGSGFVPPGAQTADQLARLAVRIGPVHVHVPLVPVPGGFANPSDAVLTVPVPVDVEPGQVEVQVVTAAGVETNRVMIDVTD